LEIMADGNPDAYLDWKTTSYGFSANASISGDAFWYNTFSTYPPFNFYGVDYYGLQFTADGLAGWPDAVSAVNTPIPDPTDPNNIMALFWDDFIVQYDLANNYGVSLVGDGASFATIEYDDVQLKADTSKTLDMEVGYFLQPDDAPGMYEIVFAYDNITPGLFAAASGTIGVENVDGTVGTQFSYNDTALTIADGSAICFDWALLPAPPKVITFQVTVDADGDGIVVNEALHSNDAPYTVEEAAIAEFDTLIPEPLLNEFSVNTTGDDVEYIEIIGVPDTDYSDYTVLEIEGDYNSNSSEGFIDEVIPLTTTDANGLMLISLAVNKIENGTVSLLLVKYNTGVLGDDIDADDDGVIDMTYWSKIVDSVSVYDGGPDDLPYGVPVLGPNYDGLSTFAPGGASRIPDGMDTDTAADWVRNDFDLAGIPGFDGTPIFGEAYNTPGEFNRIVPFVVYLPILFK